MYVKLSSHQVSASVHISCDSKLSRVLRSSPLVMMCSIAQRSVLLPAAPGPTTPAASRVQLDTAL